MALINNSEKQFKPVKVIKMVDLSFFNLEENQKSDENRTENNDSFNQITSSIDEELKTKIKKYKSLTSKALKKIRLNYGLSLKEKKIAHTNENWQVYFFQWINSYCDFFSFSPYC